MGFSALDFDKIYEFSGKEFLEAEFKEFTCIPKQKLGGQEFDIGITVDLSKFKKAFEKKKKNMTDEEKEKFDEERKSIRQELDKFAKETAEKLSNFRVRIYASVLDKMLNEVINKKNPKTLKFHLNDKNVLYVIPSTDRIQLLYGIDFLQTTDQSLARIFLLELKEVKNHVRNCIDAKVYTETSEFPKQFKDSEEEPQNFSNGLCMFDLFTKNYKTIKPLLNYFVTFREYIQFHIHSIKTFLHIRMNRKGNEFQGKLDGCRIIPDDYIKQLETLEFYSKWNKKEENLKVFTDEVKKLNV